MPFRATHPADATLLAEIHLDAYRGGHADWDTDFFEKMLALPTTRGLICHDGEQPLGFILWQQTAETGEVITIAVLATRQGKGLGAQLLDAYERALIEGEIPQSILDVAEDNAPARALYHGAGYESLHRRPGYYRSIENGVTRQIDALVLQKILSPL